MLGALHRYAFILLCLAVALPGAAATTVMAGNRARTAKAPVELAAPLLRGRALVGDRLSTSTGRWWAVRAR